MLSQETIDVVKSTVPLLAEHGEAITGNFYDRLFTNHPELKHVFNQANQSRGDQSRALADAVFAYAQNIDNLAVLLPAVERIAHKHASLGIKPEQYPIVGENLLNAIQEVLGLPDGHAALSAWGEAYGVLANVFIGAEETIYQKNEDVSGGWRGFKNFVIDEITTETPEVKSIYLRAEDGSDVPSFKGGQYVGLKVSPPASNFEEIRQYSLSGKAEKKRLRISTKAENKGLVSNYLHSCQRGDVVQLQAPTGVFTLNSNAKKHVFIAGGVGITPLMSMLYEALEKGIKANDILFIQCARGQEYKVFGDELPALQKAQGFHYKSQLDKGTTGDYEGYLNEGILARWLNEADVNTPDTAVYFCGPMLFMHALNECFKAIGFNPQQINYEVFGPSESLN